MPSSELVDTAAMLAADKALEWVGGFVGGKAGDLARRAFVRIGPTLGRQIIRRAVRAKRKPLKTLVYIGLGAATAAFLWKAISQQPHSNR